MQVGEKRVTMATSEEMGAELILQALNEVTPRGLTYSELSERTALPVETIEQNVKLLTEQKKLLTKRDGHGKLFVTLHAWKPPQSSAA